MTMGYTAQDTYGFRSWSPATPGGIAVMAETQIGEGHELSGAVMGRLPLGINNPLFWVLVGVLVFTGWLYLGGSFGIKKIGSASLKVGR